MAANILGLRDRLDDEDDIDNLLGILKTQGMTDNDFEAAGLAPVDELWAGRYSAAIDDREFDDKVALASAARDKALDSKPVHMSGPAFNRPKSEEEWIQNSRDYISDESGLDLYPGHLRSDEKRPIFMQEFSDEGAALVPGYMEAIKASEGGEVTRLGDVFDHPELYTHYPESQLLPISFGENMRDGHRGTYFSPSEGAGLGVMQINPAITDDEMNRETILHEMQHFIQRAEGWEGGGMSGSEAGRAYANDMARSANAHPDELQNPQAQGIYDRIDDMYNNSKEVMPFMKREELHHRLGQEGYETLSGEQLARDATARDASGDQVGNYYGGPTDSVEYQNWNHTDATFKPMEAMPKVRQFLTDNGLLGPLNLDEEGNLIKIDAEDPYVKEYLQGLFSGEGLKE